MQSIRRVALRSVASAARAAAPKATPTAQFAAQFQLQNAIVKQSAVSMARYFSQSVRVMNENEQTPNVESEVTESAAPTETTQQQNVTVDPPHGVWVRNFVFDINEDHLKELFGKFGTVVQARIVRDARGLSKGFGFVYLSSDAEVAEAIAELNGSFWHGRRVHMEKQSGDRRERSPRRDQEQRRPDLPNEPTRFLYIGNIPYEASDAELNRLFRGLDNLEDVRVAVDRVTGFPRGFAHADFTDVAAAQKAFEKLAGFDLGGRPLRVDYAGSAIQTKRSSFGGRKDRRDSEE